MSRHSYVPQTISDAMIVIERDILLLKYIPKHWIINCDWSWRWRIVVFHSDLSQFRIPWYFPDFFQQRSIWETRKGRKPGKESMTDGRTPKIYRPPTFGVWHNYQRSIMTRSKIAFNNKYLFLVNIRAPTGRAKCYRHCYTVTMSTTFVTYRLWARRERFFFAKY